MNKEAVTALIRLHAEKRETFRAGNFIARKNNSDCYEVVELLYSSLYSPSGEGDNPSGIITHNYYISNLKNAVKLACTFARIATRSTKR